VGGGGGGGGLLLTTPHHHPFDFHAAAYPLSTRGHDGSRSLLLDGEDGSRVRGGGGGGGGSGSGLGWSRGRGGPRRGCILEAAGEGGQVHQARGERGRPFPACSPSRSSFASHSLPWMFLPSPFPSPCEQVEVMKRQDVVAEVAARTGLPKASADAAVSAFIDTVIEAVTGE
jgi:hypothetical protein